MISSLRRVVLGNGPPTAFAGARLSRLFAQIHGSSGAYDGTIDRKGLLEADTGQTLKETQQRILRELHALEVSV